MPLPEKRETRARGTRRSLLTDRAQESNNNLYIVKEEFATNRREALARDPSREKESVVCREHLAQKE